MARRSITITAGAVGAGALLLAGMALPAQAAGATTTCVGSVSGATVPGNLVVPAGESCSVTDSTVAGRVSVGAGADLLVDNVTVAGTVTVASDGLLDSLDSDMASTVSLTRSYGAYLEGSHVGGEVISQTAGFTYSVDSQHDRDVRSANGELYLEGSSVAERVMSIGDLLSDINNTTINGTVLIDGAQLGSILCDSEIDGQTIIRNSADFVQIGGDSPRPGCGTTVFGGELSLRTNKAAVSVNDAIIGGDLFCTGNAVMPTGADNRVRGAQLGNCATLGAEATMKIQQRSLAVPAEERKSDALDRLEERRATAAEAVAAAGVAKI